MNIYEIENKIKEKIIQEVIVDYKFIYIIISPMKYGFQLSA